MVDPGELVLAPYNPRRIADDALGRLVKLLDAHGFIDPIIARRGDNLVIGGHQRLKANGMRENPDELVPVVFLEAVSDAKAKALNIALNNQYAQGEFDMPKLADLLQDIDVGEFDVSDFTAFSLDDIAGLMHGLDEFQAQEDEAPALEDEAISQLGDLWLMGEHRLLCGDSTKAECAEQVMDGRAAGVMIADVPYGMRLDADFSGMVNTLAFAQARGVKRGRKYDNIVGDDVDFNAGPLAAIFAAVPNQYWFGADYYASTLPDTEHCGAWLVWDKRLDDSADKMFGSCFELIWASKRCKRDILRHKWAGIFGTEHEPVRGRVHPNQKPVALLADLVRRGEGSIVDPCAGSGQTIIACEQLGRKCYAIEIEPRYVDVAVRRWQSFTGKEATLEGDGRTFAEISDERAA